MSTTKTFDGNIGDLTVSGTLTSGAKVCLTSNTTTTGFVSWSTLTEYGTRTDLIDQSTHIITFNDTGNYLITGTLNFRVTTPSNFFFFAIWEDNATGANKCIGRQNMSGTGLMHSTITFSLIESITATDTRRLLWGSTGSGTTPTLMGTADCAETNISIIKI